MSFQAHKDIITSLSLFETDRWFILTCSMDGLIKIWSTDGDIMAQLNINHPLPIQWDINTLNR